MPHQPKVFSSDSHPNAKARWVSWRPIKTLLMISNNFGFDIGNRPVFQMKNSKLHTFFGFRCMYIIRSSLQSANSILDAAKLIIMAAIPANSKKHVFGLSRRSHWFWKSPRPIPVSHNLVTDPQYKHSHQHLHYHKKNRDVRMRTKQQEKVSKKTFVLVKH